MRGWLGRCVISIRFKEVDEWFERGIRINSADVSGRMPGDITVSPNPAESAVIPNYLQLV